MTQFKVVIGSVAYWPVQTWNRGNVSRPAYASTDTFTCAISRGQGQAPLFAPTISWYTADGTQTGYDQGDVVVSISAAQSALLEASGTYLGEVWWTQQTACVARFTLTAEVAAGTATQVVTPYGSYQDMLLHASWITQNQKPNVDQEGFYGQRIEARNWFDDLIIASWQGTSSAPFGSPGVSMYSWNGGWGGNYVLPSKWLRDQLAANRLILRPKVIRACTFKAISIVGLNQVGGGNTLAAQGQMFASRADAEALSITAELDTSTPMSGLAGMAIPLGVGNVLFG